MKTIKITVNGREIRAEIKDSDFEDLEDFVDFEKACRPKMGETYFTVVNGRCEIGIWENHEYDEARLKIGNCFWGQDGERDAKHYLKFLKYSAIRGNAVKGEEFWIWDFEDNKVCECTSWSHFLTQKKFKTKKDCEKANIEQYQDVIDKFTQRNF